jgi:hypothetical protein
MIANGNVIRHDDIIFSLQQRLVPSLFSSMTSSLNCAIAIGQNQQWVESWKCQLHGQQQYTTAHFVVILNPVRVSIDA